MNRLKRLVTCFVCILISLSCMSIYNFPGASAAETETVRVGFFEFGQYHRIDSDGRRSGYGYDYLQYMARYNNWKYEYVGYDKSWSDMLDMLDSGEIDMVTSAHKTDERLLKYDFSDNPIGISSTILTVRAGNTSYSTDDYSSMLDGFRVGMLIDNSRNESFKRYADENGFTYDEVYFNDNNDLMKALQDGSQIDAAVTSNLRTIDNEWIIAQFDASPYYAIVRKGNTELLDEVNHSIEQIDMYNPGLQTELFNKYYRSQSAGQIAFSVEEKCYIGNNVSENLKAVIEPDKKPLSYYEEGKPEGIVADIAAEIMKRSGLKVEFLPVSSHEEYNNIVQLGQADIVFDMPADMYNTEEMGYKLTDSYLDVPYVQLYRSGEHLSSSNNRFAACICDELVVRQNNLNVGAEYYDNTEAAVESVINGDSDTCFINIYSGNLAIYNDVSKKLAYLNQDKGMAGQISVAVNNSAAEQLLPILEKAVHSIEQRCINDIVDKRTTYEKHSFSLIRYIYSNPDRVLMTFVGIIMLLFIIAVVSMRHRRLKQLRKQQAVLEHFVTYVCRANTFVGETDAENKLSKQYSISDGRMITSEYTYENWSMLDGVVHPDDLDTAYEHYNEDSIRTLAADMESSLFEIRLKAGFCKDSDSYRWYRVIHQGMSRDAKHPCSIMIFINDIDEQKRVDEQKRQILQDALIAAEQASTAKGIFTSRMSHEIRTPLNAVIGYMTIAKSNFRKPERVEDCIFKAETAAKHLLQIINDVLDMSSIESGKMKLSNSRFDLRQLVTNLSEMYYIQCRDKCINFEVMLSDTLEEWLVGDELRLNQILINILGNAVKFTPEGGNIYFSVKQLAVKDGHVYLKFGVADSGIGMTREFQKRLFMPFEQQDASISQNFGGTGLGLSITRNLVNMMGGTISVESEQGAGTTFMVELPFGHDELEGGEGTIRQDFSDVHALVVDDEEHACEYMTLLLKRCGVRSEAVYSGKMALEAIKDAYEADDAYDLCLMDWKMPDMDGVETVKQVRESEAGDIPIIIVTAYDFSEIEEEARKAGVDMCVSKPLFQSTVFNLLVSTYGKYVPKETEGEQTFDYNGKHVMLAEDNEMNMEIATEILSHANLNITGVSNGHEAYEEFVNSAPGTYDLLLLDIMMPIMNGYDAARKIRGSQHPDAKKIPIIAMTANAFTEDISAALAAGMNDHIAKPIDVEQLFSTLGKYIG